MKSVILLILDGLALRSEGKGNAFYHANAQFLKSLLEAGVFSCLKTFGSYVGLPEGQMGNSEVGHMNLGAGRIVKQQQVLLDEAVIDFSLFREIPTNNELHLIGLVSSGGVHSHIRHLIKLDDYLWSKNSRAFLHIITDGRDTLPRHFLNDWSSLSLKSLVPVSLIGRYYAMDRDKRWDRIRLAYDLVVHGFGTRARDPIEAVERFYSESNLSDEFIPPYVLGNYQGVKDPCFIFFNFREDRMRQLAAALCELSFGGDFKRERIFEEAYSFVQLDRNFKNIKPLLKQEPLKWVLGEVISDAGYAQLRAAETEKYPHVTYFFNGGREDPFPLEDRILVPSPRDIPTYDMKPEMSAFELTDQILKVLSYDYKLVVVNFANCDMVGHTGSFDAAVKACEVVDKCTLKLVKRAAELGFWSIITSDHGNCEEMIDPVGSPHTAHTLNDVFFILVDENFKSVPVKGTGLLASVAPTVLQIMNLKKPEVMFESLLF